MSFQGLVLVLLASLIHATWNMMVKSSKDKIAFFWLALMVSLVVYLPPLLWMLPNLPFQWSGWPYVVATGVLHALYFLLLGKAYSAGDLSVVYPIARGSSPLIVLIGAMILLGEYPTTQGWLGILLVVAGAFLLHAPLVSLPRTLEGFRNTWGPASKWAILTGFSIATYSLVDKIGVSLVHPFLYIYLMFFLSALLMTPFALGSWRESVVREWREGAYRVLAVGVMFFLSYGMILMALRIDPVSYVVAVREVSIVFGATLGVFVLKEGHVRSRLSASAVLAAGVVLIGLIRPG